MFTERESWNMPVAVVHYIEQVVLVCRIVERASFIRFMIMYTVSTFVLQIESFCFSLKVY